MKDIQDSKQHHVEAKKQFSMASNNLIPTMLKQATGQDHGCTDVEYILCGIESHVCVLQTAQDLLQEGAQVHIVRDGVSSCNRKEIPIAVQVRFPRTDIGYAPNGC